MFGGFQPSGQVAAASAIVNRAGLSTDRPAASVALTGVTWTYTDVGSATYTGRVDRCDGTSWIMIVPPAGTLSAKGELSRSPAYKVRADRLMKFNTGRGRVVAGSGAAKILGVGDSTMWGRIANAGDPSDSAMHRLAALLGGVDGLAIPAASGLTDLRWSAGTGWGLSSAAGFGSGVAWLAAAGASGALTFTPRITCDTFDVYWAASSGNGTVQASVDSDVASTVNTTVGTTVGKTTISASGVAPGHVLTFQTVATGPVYILGIEAYDSTNPQIRVGNAGVSGSTSTHWNNTGLHSALNCIKAYAPDLTLINLGINDAAISALDVATWAANMTAIVQAAQVSGDVLLMSVVPHSNLTTAALEASYRAYLDTLADQLGCGWIDIWSLFGGAYAPGQALTWYSDSTHPSALGYGVMAAAIRDALGVGDPVVVPPVVGAWGIVRPPWMPSGLTLVLTNGTANTMWYFRVVEGGTISNVRIHIGTSSGNICVAAYANSGSGLTSVPGSLLASSGSVASPGTGARDIPLGKSVTLRPGDWIAIGADNTTVTFEGPTAGAGASTALSGMVCSQAVFPAPNVPSSLAVQNNRMFAFVGVP